MSAIINLMNSILLAINSFTHNYGLTIIVLTFIIKIITWPLMSKQLASARAMQEMQPELKKIQEKYKNDQAKLNQATMELWQKYNVNPLAGCLPLLIQLPILWAMFQVLRSPEGLTGSTLFLGIDMLQALQTADGWQTYPGYWILVFLSAATTFLYQKIAMTDNSQRAMTFMMPLLLLYFSIKVQSGLVLYWVVSNLLSLAQHLIVNRRPMKGAVSEE